MIGFTFNLAEKESGVFCVSFAKLKPSSRNPEYICNLFYICRAAGTATFNLCYCSLTYANKFGETLH